MGKPLKNIISETVSQGLIILLKINLKNFTLITSYQTKQKLFLKNFH